MSGAVAADRPGLRSEPPGTAELLCALSYGSGLAAADQMEHAAAIVGLDVSGHQQGITWSTVASNGAQFAYIKATEGTTVVNGSFASEYDGAYQAGLIRGAYHFALPSTSSGAAQASYFVANGGPLVW